MSLVCRAINKDFDPGGAAEACKFYPQLALSWTRTESDAPKVLRLHGCVEVVANNRLTTHDHGHGGMVMNAQRAMLLADSNNSRTDADYGWTRPPLTFPPTPSGSFVPAWRSGRLLGGLDRPGVIAVYLPWFTYAEFLGKALAPVLPEWSWLFDYGRAVNVGPEVLEVVVWAEDDGPRGRHRRTDSTPWPPNPDPAFRDAAGRPPTLTIEKYPRQGAFDNLHVNADMGSDGDRVIIAAPFCADVCLHLHVRWGVLAAESATIERAPFLGWTGGRHPVAHAALGSPLVPPNQQVSFGITRPDAAQTKIRYVVQVSAPREGRRQVDSRAGHRFRLHLWRAGPVRPPVADRSVRVSAPAEEPRGRLHRR